MSHYDDDDNGLLHNPNGNPYTVKFRQVTFGFSDLFQLLLLAGRS